MRISVEQIGGTETLLVPNDSTVRTAVQLVTGRDAANYTAQVNDACADSSQALREGDLLSIVPTKVKGAIA